MVTQQASIKQTNKSIRIRGGVSPKRGSLERFETQADASSNQRTSNIARLFRYHGGPIITHPQVYTSFWGSLWGTDPQYQALARHLNQFHANLLQSGFMNVLSQYGVGSGAFVGATFVNSVPDVLTDQGIQGIIQSSITAGMLPEPSNPSNIALIIYLDEHIGINDPADHLVLCMPTSDVAFGYHSSFTTTAGNPFYYAVIPALADACLRESCSVDAHCSLHLSEDQEQRMTQVASHEFAEMTTDPEGNGWYAPDPWGENGDICNGETDIIVVGANSWTVQKTYSKYDDRRSHGAVHCIGQAPQPLPRLLQAPVASRPRQASSYEQLLPLPSRYFDASANIVSIDEQQTQEYVLELFTRLGTEGIVTDVPGFLRQAADVLAKR